MSSFSSIANYSLPNLDKITVPDLIVVTPPSATFNWVTPAVSLICAVAGAYAAWRIGSKAREITAQQRDIAAQAKQIAQDKLDLDLFEKRYNIIFAYNNIFQKSRQKELTKNEIVDSIIEFQGKFMYFPAIFNKDDLKTLTCAQDYIVKIFKVRLKYLIKDGSSSENENELSKLYEELKPYLAGVRNLLIKYSTDSMKRIPITYLSTTRPASSDKPQPTGLKAFRARLKRAACEWKRPLP